MATSHEAGPGTGGLRTLRNEQFDGKQLRKAIARRTVDFNSSAMRWYLDRTWQDELSGDVPALQPTFEATVELTPPASAQMRHNGITSVCTNFVHTSMNKPGCAINSCKWTPEGKRMITGAATGEFTLWHGLTFNFETILQAHDSAVRCIIWSHDEKWMLSGDQNGSVKYWQSNMNNLKVFRAHEANIRDIAFSLSDLKFATASDDGAIHVWDFVRCELERRLTGHGWDVRCMDWHPYMALIASGSKDSQIKLWDAKTGENLSTLHGHKNTVVSMSFNQNGHWLLTGSRDQLIRCYDIRMLRPFCTFRGHRREVTSLKWHPVHEDMFVSGSYDGHVYYWIVGESDPVATIRGAHQSSIWDMDWHPMGHILATASNDHATKFWTRNRPGDALDDRYNSQIEEGDNLGGRNRGRSGYHNRGRNDNRRGGRMNDYGGQRGGGYGGRQDSGYREMNMNTQGGGNYRRY